MVIAFPQKIWKKNEKMQLNAFIHFATTPSRLTPRHIRQWRTTSGGETWVITRSRWHEKSRQVLSTVRKEILRSTTKREKENQEKILLSKKGRDYTFCVFDSTTTTTRHLSTLLRLIRIKWNNLFSSFALLVKIN